MIRFNCDYLEGAHPRILEALSRTNMEQLPGYSEDDYCSQARERIKELCQCPQAAVHFLVGGTQTNITVITAALRPHQGVIAARTGHISCHETGAIEAAGHKVLELETPDGKLTADMIEREVLLQREDLNHEHIVQPGMVYISMSTEMGGIYSRRELEALHEVCRRLGLYLYLDGARLGYSLCAPGSDLDLPAIARYCDVFYIGGTKVGALFGEAVVIVNEAIQKDFRYIIKQRGGMLAKGRLLGLQFLTLFEDGLYFQLSRHAIAMAEKLKAGIAAKGYTFYSDSPTNLQFIVLDGETARRLAEEFSFEIAEKLEDGRIVARFCTSWATLEKNVDKLIESM